MWDCEVRQRKWMNERQVQEEKGRWAWVRLALDGENDVLCHYWDRSRRAIHQQQWQVERLTALSFCPTFLWSWFGVSSTSHFRDVIMPAVLNDENHVEENKNKELFVAQTWKHYPLKQQRLRVICQRFRWLSNYLCTESMSQAERDWDYTAQCTTWCC